MGLDLSWLLAILIIALVVWKEGNRILAPVTKPIVALLGRAYGATIGNYMGQQPATELLQVNEPVTALESDVAPSYEVTKVTLEDMEIAWISYELGRGTTPSATAKTLPGYSPKAYKDHAGKVGLVEALLAEKAAIERQREKNTAAISAKASTSQEQAKAL